MSEAISIKDVFDEIKNIEKKMVTKKDLKSLFDSIEILSNPDTMKQIISSENDIENNRARDVDSVQDILK